MRVGILHPGAMGVRLAQNMDADVLWASDGRSPATTRRAKDAGLRDVGSLADLIEEVEVIFSVCPPAAAIEVAEKVAGLGYGGLYVDANAVAPLTARHIDGLFARFVDGGIVGGPPPGPRASGERTRLYVSGPEVESIQDLFAGANVDVRVVDGGPGGASAVKMGYAGWTKGSAALLMAMAAYARSEGVLDDLLAEWSESIPGLPERLEGLARRVANKAWRFVGEMDEIAVAQENVGLPRGFHDAAADIYSRLSDLKMESDPMSVFELLESLDRT